MIPQKIVGYTRTLGAPRNWDERSQGHCGELPILDTVHEESRMQVMMSEWKPTPQELRKLVAGGSLFLTISGTQHPVVGMSVGDP